jgi:hypothetical protein
MKIQVDGKTVHQLNETQKKVIQNDIQSEIFQSDMERRVAYIIHHKYEQCFDRLKKEWEPKLQGRVQSVPTNPDALAELIFSQPDYKSRSIRDKESQLSGN